MSKKTTKISDLSTFDPARYLRDDDIGAYLTQIIEEGDSGPRFDTIAKVCKALGMRIVVQAEHSA